MFYVFMSNINRTIVLFFVIANIRIVKKIFIGYNYLNSLTCEVFMIDSGKREYVFYETIICHYRMR